MRIGDVYAERSERGAEDMELLSVTMNDGVKMRSDIEGKDNSSEDKSNYKIVRAGDMVYNSMRMWQGANGISPWDGIVSPAYTVLKPRMSISNGFFAALFKTHRLINEFRKNSQGMTSDTWNLKYPQIETIKTCIPVLAEQEKIADFLIALDQRIEKQRTLVEHLKKYKRGLLSVVFSRELSFSDGQWISKPFAEIAHLGKKRYTPSPNESKPCIELEHIEQLTGRLLGSVNSSEQNSQKSAFEKGDVLFGKLRPYLKKYALPDFEGVCSTEIWVFKPTEWITSEFLYYLVQSEGFINAANISSGTKMPRAEWSKVASTVFFLPNIEDQTKIVNLLMKIDKKINTESMLLEKLEQFKKASLQKLFV